MPSRTRVDNGQRTRKNGRLQQEEEGELLLVWGGEVQLANEKRNVLLLSKSARENGLNTTPSLFFKKKKNRASFPP